MTKYSHLIAAIAVPAIMTGWSASAGAADTPTISSDTVLYNRINFPNGLFTETADGVKTWAKGSDGADLKPAATKGREYSLKVVPDGKGNNNYLVVDLSNPNTDKDIKIDSTYLVNSPFEYRGWEIGAIAIPVKYSTGGTTNRTSTNPTVGTHIGYTRGTSDIIGASVQVSGFLFVGATSVAGTRVAAGQSQTNNLSAASGGVGFDISLWNRNLTTQSFNVGVAFGYDLPFNADGNSYNHHPWFGLLTSYKWVF